MKVLQVVPVGSVGGVQTHVADLAAGLTERGVQVIVASGSEGMMTSRLRDAGIDVLIVPMRRRTDLWATARLVQFIRAADPDIVHTHSPIGGIIGRTAAVWAGRPAVHTFHGLGILDELASPRSIWHRAKLASYRCHERWLNTRTEALIAVSPSVAKGLVSARHAPSARLSIVPHGVQARPPRAAAQRWHVVYVGRLHPEKGVDQLLLAFARVHASFPRAQLQLIGDGPMRSMLEEQVASLGLNGQVELLGERQDVAPFLDEAACVVLASRAEGFSYVLLEAMARGVPCIATAVGGTPDLIEGGQSGLLVPPEDPRALADAIASVLTDSVQAGRLGEVARRRVATEFSREQMVAQTLEVYRTVLSRRSA